MIPHKKLKTVWEGINQRYPRENKNVDFDFDGDLDLFIFDRSRNSIRVYTQEGTIDKFYKFIGKLQSSS